MIFIAYDNNEFVLSIVNAKSKELAVAYWHGLGLLPYFIKSLDKDFVSLDKHPTGVIPILKTKSVNVSSLYHEYSKPENINLILVEKI